MFGEVTLLCHSKKNVTFYILLRDTNYVTLVNYNTFSLVCYLTSQSNFKIINVPMWNSAQLRSPRSVLSFTSMFICKL